MKLPDKNWFIKVRVSINLNGCWISKYAIRNDGYVRVQFDNRLYLLHRLSMCVYKDLDYFDYKIDSRHGDLCIKSCYNPEHIIPGTHLQNMRDAVLLGKFIKNSNINCPRCGNKYETIVNKRGESKGKIQKYCRYCSMIRRRV